MQKREFLLLLDELLEQPGGTVKGTEALEDLGWDSIKLLEFAALVDERLNKELEAEPLASCRTVSHLLELVQDRIDG